MKILLLGKDGQVGWELQRSLSPLGELVLLGSGDRGDLVGDFNQPERLAATVCTIRPDVVVNAAAYTAVDRAETEPDVARLVNATAVGALARAAAHCRALLVHYSTDHVFDGLINAPRTESDPTAPVNVYGQTKLEGERLIARHCARHLILRTSWVYAARGQNFARTILTLASERERLSVVDDQHGAPTGAELLADVTAHALRAAITDNELCGLYHVVAAGETTWNAYARYVIEEAARAGLSLKLGASQVDGVPTSSVKSAARRPLSSRLSTEKLRQAFGLTMPRWQTGVSRMLDEIVRLQQEKVA